MSGGKAGAPTLYKPAYCVEVIACLSEGHSFHGFAGLIGVGRRTVFDWMERHEEFKSACDIATSKAVYYWEQRLSECAKNGKGNVAAVIFGLKNRAHEDWRDVHKIEHKIEKFDELDAADQDAIIAGINEELARRESQAASNPESQPSKPVSSLH